MSDNNSSVSIQRVIGRRLSYLAKDLRFSIKGTVYTKRTKCGKPGCKCTRGELHEYQVLSYYEGKEKKEFYLKDENQVTIAKRYCENYKDAKKRIEKLSLLNIELLKKDLIDNTVEIEREKKFKREYRLK